MNLMTSRSDFPRQLLGKPAMAKLWAYRRDNPESTPTDYSKESGLSLSGVSHLSKRLDELSPDFRNHMVLPEGMGLSRPGIVLVWNALLKISKLDGLPFRTTIKQVAVLSGVHRGSSGKLLRDLREKGFVKYNSLGKSGILVMEL